MMRNMITSFALALAILQLSAAKLTARGLEVGQKVPEFSAQDFAGKPFDYKHGGKKALLLAFVSPKKQNSADAIADINKIVANLGTKEQQLTVVIVVNDPNRQTNFEPKQGQFRPGYNVIVDKNYALWGEFGIIATPTTIIADKNDTVLRVKPGYGYNFAPTIRMNLDKALGITRNNLAGKQGKVEIAIMTSDAARAVRYLQMAEMLKKTGKLESAILPTQKACQLDPNNFDAAFKLAELYCKTAKEQNAIEAIAKAKPATPQQKAKVSLIAGWANRRLNKLDQAEKKLLEAKKLDPKSIRVLFELGKVYQAKKQTQNAMRAYRNALAILFGEPKQTKTLTPKAAPN